jgi:adenine-specific DNA-methyltransferase
VPATEREHVATTSADPTADRIAALKGLFPDAFADGKLDVAKLRAALGEVVAGDGERYTFSWAGRTDAVEALRMPTRATLLPVPDQSVNFDTTKNLYVEGDNLEVLKLLYKPYAGRVKLIYIDPPYNTGNDFIYPDDFRDTLANYLKLTNQTDDAGNLLRSNPDTSGRYHSDWLSMMYPRLFLARQLLRDDGVIFVSLDDHEVHHLRLLMNEVFGEENFVAVILWQKVFSPKNSAMHFSEDHDYVVIYAKDAAGWRPNLLARSEEATARYTNPDNDSRGEWSSSDMTARNYYSDGQYEVVAPGGAKFTPSRGNYWRFNHERFQEMDKDNRIWWGEEKNSMPRLKRFLSEVKSGVVPQTMWFFADVGHTQEAKKELLEFVPFQDTDNVLDTVKPTRLLRRILHLATNHDTEDIVLDFFSGSAGMAHAVLAHNRDDGGNRRFIMVQLPEPLPVPEKQLKRLTDIGQTRIRNVVAKLKGEAGNLTRTEPEDLGFKVFKLAESHFAQWSGTAERTPAAYKEQLRLIADDPLRKGWTPNGLLWEVAVKEGYGLNSVIEPVGNTTATVYRVSDPEKGQHFLACLDDKLPADITRQLGLTKDDLFVVRDLALDDTLASNLALQCRLKVI